MRNMRWLPRAAGVLAILSGCAMTPESQTDPLITEEAMLPSDPGVSVYVSNKRPAGHTYFSPEKTVLYVHGATYPSETAFDLRLAGFSWMDYIARAGYDVWLVDVRGYGGSTRPPAMDQPASANPPFATTAEAVKDVGAAVDHILRKRGIGKLNLIGWSWGTVTMAWYTAQNN